MEPIKEVEKFIKEYFLGILNAILLEVTIDGAGSINSRVKMIIILSRGFCNKARYKNANYFHIGGLALYIEGVNR